MNQQVRSYGVHPSIPELSPEQQRHPVNSIYFAAILLFRSNFISRMDAVANFYSGPQVGNGIPVYSGSRRQMGSGLWGTIQRIARPILAKFTPRFGRTVADKTISALAGAASDALNQRSSFADSLKARGKVHLQETMNFLMRQTGGKRGVKRRLTGSRPSRKRPLK